MSRRTNRPESMSSVVLAGESMASAMLWQPRRLLTRRPGDHVGSDGRDHDARLAGEQVDAHERHANPSVNHDALVEYPVENVDEVAAAGGALTRHPGSLPRVSAAFHARDPPASTASSGIPPRRRRARPVGSPGAGSQ